MDVSVRAMWLLHTQSPKHRVSWQPPPLFKFIKTRGNTPGDGWYWVLATEKQAIALANIILLANRGKSMRLKLRQVKRLPKTWE